MPPGRPGEVAVTLSASDPGLLPEGGAFAAALADGGRLTFEAPLAGVAPGDYALTVETVTPGGARLRKRLTVPVRANDPVLARQDRIELAAGSTLTLDADVLDGLAPGTAEATVAIGPLAAFDVPGLLTALEAYPWGCTEQIVSRAMPLLYFAATAAGLGIARMDEVEARLDDGDPGRPRQPDRRRRLRPLERRGERRRLARRLCHRLPRPRARPGPCRPRPRLRGGARQPREPRQRLWRLRERAARISPTR